MRRILFLIITTLVTSIAWFYYNSHHQEITKLMEERNYHEVINRTESSIVSYIDSLSYLRAISYFNLNQYDNALEAISKNNSADALFLEGTIKIKYRSKYKDSKTKAAQELNREIINLLFSSMQKGNTNAKTELGIFAMGSGGHDNYAKNSITDYILRKSNQKRESIVRWGVDLIAEAVKENNMYATNTILFPLFDNNEKGDTTSFDLMISSLINHNFKDDPEYYLMKAYGFKEKSKQQLHLLASEYYSNGKYIRPNAIRAQEHFKKVPRLYSERYRRAQRDVVKQNLSLCGINVVYEDKHGFTCNNQGIFSSNAISSVSYSKLPNSGVQLTLTITPERSYHLSNREYALLASDIPDILNALGQTKRTSEQVLNHLSAFPKSNKYSSKRRYENITLQYTSRTVSPPM